jgi:oligopeptide transport system ATP-binding protein
MSNQNNSTTSNSKINSNGHSNINTDKDVILSIRNLKKHFPIKKGLLLKEVGQVKAVDDITLDIYRGETVGLVGESGCGKSTLGRTIIRLYEPTGGSIQFKGKEFLGVKGAELRKMRKDMQMIFQDPNASLDPRMTIGQILTQPFDVHNIVIV